NASVQEFMEGNEVHREGSSVIAPACQLLFADDKHPLWQASCFRTQVLDATHNQCTCGASDDLRLGERVRVGMVPVKARRFVRRNAKAVCKRWSVGLDRCVDHFVLMTRRRDVQAMKMYVGGRRRHGATFTGVWAGAARHVVSF